MPENTSTFAEKFLRRIRKVDTEQIEVFLQQVLREKAFLEIVFDSLTEGVIVTERAGKVVFINDAARQLLGLLRVECVGRPVEKLIRARALLRLAEEYAAGLLEPILQREIQIRTPAVRTYAVSLIPIENEEGLATHTVWIISDRTEANRRHEEARQRESIEALGALTAGVAHEVKNPLNSLNIHAQLSQKALADLKKKVGSDSLTDRLDHSISVILEEIQRTTRIVDNFIKAVRPVTPDLRPHELNKIMIDVAELLGPDCRTRNIELTLDLDPEIPRLRIDRDQILQAVLNIAKNGMEAIDKPEGKLTLRTELKSDHVLVEVEDNGCGIAEEERLRIFEPYHTTKFHGTGLGLMMVFRIVRAHRGAIGLRSELGVGTIFSVALPLDERPVRMLEAQVDPRIVDFQQPGEPE